MLIYICVQQVKFSSTLVFNSEKAKKLVKIMWLLHQIYITLQSHTSLHWMPYRAISTAIIYSSHVNFSVCKWTCWFVQYDLLVVMSGCMLMWFVVNYNCSVALMVSYMTKIRTINTHSKRLLFTLIFLVLYFKPRRLILFLSLSFFFLRSR